MDEVLWVVLAPYLAIRRAADCKNLKMGLSYLEKSEGILTH